MRKNLVLLVVALAILGAGVALAQAAKPSAADEVIAIVRAQWAAEIADPSNGAAQLKDVADDYTEFNGAAATRLDGKAMNVRLADGNGSASAKTIAGEMTNPKVQTYSGDVAIVTYNYMGLTRDKDGKVSPNRAKSTRVYVKQGGKWMMVHANFAPDPVPGQ